MKLNKQHFNLFKKECKKYIDKFGLCSWEINYKFEPLEEGTYGNCKTHYSGRVAAITLSTDFKKKMEGMKEFGFEQKLKEIVKIKINEYYSKVFNLVQLVEDLANSKKITIESIRTQIDPTLENVNLFFGVNISEFKKDIEFGLKLSEIKSKCFVDKGYMPEVHYVNFADRKRLDLELVASDFPITLIK